MTAKTTDELLANMRSAMQKLRFTPQSDTVASEAAAKEMKLAAKELKAANKEMNAQIKVMRAAIKKPT